MKREYSKPSLVEIHIDTVIVIQSNSLPPYVSDKRPGWDLDDDDTEAKAAVPFQQNAPFNSGGKVFDDKMF